MARKKEKKDFVEQPRKEKSEYKEYVERQATHMISIISQVAMGDFEVRSEHGREDDLGALSTGINMMIGEVKKRTAKLEKIKATLENKVRERTIELEKEKNTFQATIFSISDGILVIDSKGNIVIVNPASERLLGIKRSQVMGRHVLECLEDVRILDLITRKLESGHEYYSKELIVTDRESGTERVLNGRISSVLTQVGKGLGTVIVLRDITKEKEVDRMKTDFVSNVSHELRTPLASIKGFVSTLLGTEVSEDEQKEFLTIINQESDRLNQLIEDLLDLSRIESGRVRLNFEPVNISEKIEKLKIEVFEKIKKKGLFLETEALDSLPMVKADKNALLQILVNLVGNAIKFTEKGSILVKAEPWNSGKYIRISVQDTGTGIEGKHLEKIFEKFYRVESVAHTIPGTGLGLAIVKDLVEKHKGKVWIESKLGKGSTFYFTIPAFTEGKDV